MLAELIRFAVPVVNTHLGVVIPYPDPGSGLLLWQALGAIVTAILFRSRRMLWGLFDRHHPPPPASADQADDHRSA